MYEDQGFVINGIRAYEEFYLNLDRPNKGIVVGHGIIDFTQTIKILIRAGYEGYYSIEFDGIEPPEIGIANGLRNLHYYFEEAERQLGLFEEKALL